MNIFRRLKNIISARLHGFLDKFEDPEMMIDQYVRNLDGDLSETKVNTAQVIVAYKKAVLARESCEREIAKIDECAKAALSQGNEDDAKALIERRLNLEDRLEILKHTEALSQANKDKMLQLHDNLAADVSFIKNKQNLLKSRLAIARTRDMISKSEANITGSSKNIYSFDRMEEKIDDMESMQDAIEELDNRIVDDNVSDLIEKYDNEHNSCVEKALEELRNKSTE